MCTGGGSDWVIGVNGEEIVLRVSADEWSQSRACNEETGWNGGNVGRWEGC